MRSTLGECSDGSWGDTRALIRAGCPIAPPRPKPGRPPRLPQVRFMSAFGTFRTCRGGLTMSAPGGRTDLADATAAKAGAAH
jgi:hypothetical protein